MIRAPLVVWLLLAVPSMVACAAGGAAPLPPSADSWTPVSEGAPPVAVAGPDGSGTVVIPGVAGPSRVDLPGSASSRRFRGRPIDLNVRNADVHAVFRFLADVGHANIVVSGAVKGAVTVRLRGVRWDEALYVVARARRLRLEREGSVWFVLPHGS